MEVSYFKRPLARHKEWSQKYAVVRKYIPISQHLIKKLFISKLVILSNVTICVPVCTNQKREALLEVFKNTL